MQGKNIKVVLHEESKISVPFAQSLECSGVESVIRGPCLQVNLAWFTETLGEYKAQVWAE